MTEAQTSQSETSVTCFGTGNGCPSADRGHSAFLYRLHGASMLIDCGEPVDRAYKASGLPYDFIDGIVISHLHADHFGGLFMLLQGCLVEGRAKPLPVHLPAFAVRTVQQVLEASLLIPETLPFHLDLLGMNANQDIRIGRSIITPFPTSHLKQTRASCPNRPPALFQSFCFRLISGNMRIGHSADIGAPQDLEPLLAEPLDLLVCELAHCSAEKIFEYLRGHSIKQVAWVHLSGSHRRNISEIRGMANQILPGAKHCFPEDGDRLAI